MKIFVLLVSLLISLSANAVTSQLKLDLLFAKRGDVSAQFSVATAYEFGTDVKKDLKQAFEWYLKAANQSHAPSQYKVAYFYEKGLGVAKNIDSAMTWYKKAKANGSDQASKRLNKTNYAKKDKAKKAKRAALQAKLDQEERDRNAQNEKDRKAKKAADAKKSAQKKALAKKQEKKNTKKVVVKAKPVAKAKVAKKKQAAVKIPDILKVVLNNKWKNKQGSADFLPSASTTCLESGDNELTCFSSEKKRKVKSSTMTYTVKSSITGFKSNGSFKVFYNYNGINIAGSKSNGSDIYGLTLTEGWQEPAIAVKCNATSRKNITCYRGKNRIKFRR